MSSSLLRLSVINDNNVDVLRILNHYKYSNRNTTSKSPGSNSYETTMLHEAARVGSTNVIDALLTVAMIDVNKLEPKLFGGYSALHHACAGGFIVIVRKLLAARANPDILSNSSMKETPLHICCKLNRVECAKLLVDAGALSYIRDGFGHTASFWAHLKKYDKLIETVGLPPPVAATAKETLNLLSERLKTTVVIKPSSSKKKKTTGKKGEKKTDKKKKK